MLLAHLRAVDVGPLADVGLRFAAEERPRLATVIVGGGGTGKTSLLGAIASTRPGHALPLTRPWARAQTPPAFAVAEWLLGDDDPARPHTLTVASPNAVLAEGESEALLRRREQALFDRRASEGGFVCVAMSGARWFSRTAVMLSSPERTLLRWDPRAAATFDDATRADLARETKQVLTYAAIASALAGSAADVAATSARVLDAAVRGAIAPVARLAGVSYAGADPGTLEPMFDTDAGARVTFDDLPTSARHLVALVALPLRALAAAYAREGRDPRQCEGVALVDDVELHQEPPAQRGLVAALREALPRVQWIVATASTEVASGCEASDVIALRRLPTSTRVEIFEGELATTH